MWVWIAIAVALWLGLSVALGFGLARVLGMSRRISVDFEMSTQTSEYEAEYWATLPPTRATRAVKEEQPEEVAAKSSRVDPVHQARGLLEALRREVEAGKLSAAALERAHDGLLRLRDEADRLDRQIATTEHLLPPQKVEPDHGPAR